MIGADKEVAALKFSPNPGCPLRLDKPVFNGLRIFVITLIQIFFSQILFVYYMCLLLSLGMMKVRVRHHVIYCVQEQEYLQKAVCWKFSMQNSRW